LEALSLKESFHFGKDYNTRLISDVVLQFMFSVRLEDYQDLRWEYNMSYRDYYKGLIVQDYVKYLNDIGEISPFYPSFTNFTIEYFKYYSQILRIDYDAYCWAVSCGNIVPTYTTFKRFDDLNRSLGRWSPKKANLYEGIEDIYVGNKEIIEESGYYYISGFDSNTWTCVNNLIISINHRLSHRVLKEATAKLQRRKMKNPGNALDYAFGKRYKRLHRKVVIPMIKKSKWKSWNKRTQKLKQRAWTKKRKAQRAFKAIQNKAF